MRNYLEEDLTIFVSPSGSDMSGDGISIPFATPKRAVSYVLNALDLGGHNVNIELEQAVYSSPVVIGSRWTGDGIVTINGNGASVITDNANAVVALDNARITIQNTKLGTTGVGSSLYAARGGIIDHSGLEFMDVATSHMAASEDGMIIAELNSQYKISGGGVSHWHSWGHGRIIASYLNVEVENTPEFSAYFLGIATASISCHHTQFTGTEIKGKKYLIHYHGTLICLQPDPDAFIPGDLPGTADHGDVIV